MGHFIGHLLVQSYGVRSSKMEESNSPMMSGSILFGRERDFSIAKNPVTICFIFVLFKDTLEE